MKSQVLMNSNAYLYTKEDRAITPVVYRWTSTVEIDKLKSIGYNQLNNIVCEDSVMEYDMMVMGLMEVPEHWIGFNSFNNFDNTRDLSKTDDVLVEFYNGLVSTRTKVDKILLTTGMFLWFRDLKDRNNENVFTITEELVDGKYLVRYLNGIECNLIKAEGLVAVAGDWTRAIASFEKVSTTVETTSDKKIYSVNSNMGFYMVPEHFVKFVV